MTKHVIFFVLCQCLTDDPQDREQWIKNLQMVIDNVSVEFMSRKVTLPFTK